MEEWVLFGYISISYLPLGYISISY